MDGFVLLLLLASVFGLGYGIGSVKIKEKK